MQAKGVKILIKFQLIKCHNVFIFYINIKETVNLFHFYSKGIRHCNYLNLNP